MFPKVNALPGTQPQPSLHNWNGEAHSGQRRPYVRRHVVLAFSGVHECGVTIRDQPIEKRFKVAPHIRVCVFLNQQRGRSMQDLQGGKTHVKLFFSDP